MRFHDLHGGGRFSLIEFVQSRREREERRARRRKALSRFGPRRWLTIVVVVVRWHLASPDWGTTGRRGALSPLAPAYGLPYGQQDPQLAPFARLAALRDGRRTLARLLLDVHLIAVAGREDEVVHLLELMATGTRAQLPCQGERVH